MTSRRADARRAARQARRGSRWPPPRSRNDVGRGAAEEAVHPASRCRVAPSVVVSRAPSPYPSTAIAASMPRRMARLAGSRPSESADVPPGSTAARYAAPSTRRGEAGVELAGREIRPHLGQEDDRRHHQQRNLVDARRDLLDPAPRPEVVAADHDDGVVPRPAMLPARSTSGGFRAGDEAAVAWRDPRPPRGARARSSSAMARRPSLRRQADERQRLPRAPAGRRAARERWAAPRHRCRGRGRSRPAPLGPSGSASSAAVIPSHGIRAGRVETQPARLRDRAGDRQRGHQRHGGSPPQEASAVSHRSSRSRAACGPRRPP